MNYNLLGVVTLLAGVVLIYSAVTDRDPKEVVIQGMKGKLAPVYKAPAKPDTSKKTPGGLTIVPNTGPNQPGDGTQVVSV